MFFDGSEIEALNFYRIPKRKITLSLHSVQQILEENDDDDDGRQEKYFDTMLCISIQFYLFLKKIKQNHSSPVDDLRLKI